MQKRIRHGISFLLLVLGASALPSVALSINLILACEGTEKRTYWHYDKNRQNSNTTEESENKRISLQITDSKIFGYPCREYENVIDCHLCTQSSDVDKCKLDTKTSNTKTPLFNFTFINRYTGQTFVSSMVEVDRLRMLSNFEGSCSEAKKKF